MKHTISRADFILPAYLFGLFFRSSSHPLSPMLSVADALSIAPPSLPSVGERVKVKSN
ncbi:MAG: hypothetical protein J6Y94_04320 [Bacteriovoracaceae bacterium]|nr:hypothetical protein [Bacteriovoracaceae bacterium]